MTGRAVLVALLGAYGIHLLYTGAVMGWRGLGWGSARSGPRSGLRRAGARGRVKEWMTQAGLDEVKPSEFLTMMLVLFVLTAGCLFAVFGGVVPAVLGGLFAALFPVAGSRARRERRRSEAQEAWPRMIEEIRLLTGSVGRSIPQALFEVGARAPAELRPAFQATHREWLLSTDFERTVAVLEDRLADPTADVVCETLLVAHEVGGSDVDRVLESLAADRIQDLQGRKDARSRQAGARFARRFVLLVPLGMALAGLGIGNGRAAYQTAAGQTAVVVALAMIAGCWWWAGRIMRLPDEQRIFVAGGRANGRARAGARLASSRPRSPAVGSAGRARGRLR
jgi:tight adherence protein B